MNSLQMFPFSYKNTKGEVALGVFQEYDKENAEIKIKHLYKNKLIEIYESKLFDFNILNPVCDAASTKNMIKCQLLKGGNLSVKYGEKEFLVHTERYDSAIKVGEDDCGDIFEVGTCFIKNLKGEDIASFSLEEIEEKHIIERVKTEIIHQYYKNR